MATVKSVNVLPTVNRKEEEKTDKHNKKYKRKPKRDALLY